jgi:hypothetical protein
MGAKDRRRSHSGKLGAAFYYAATGEIDAMFEALAGACRQRDLFLLYMFFDPYQTDPRFQALL